MSQDNHGEMIFGLHEGGINEVFGGKTFDLSLVHSEKQIVLDTSVMGVSRRAQSAVNVFAPLVTYGVTVKKSNGPETFYGDLMHVNARDSVRAPLFAVYRQRKFDSNAKEYFVLSLGLSGEVFKEDIRPSAQFTPANSIQRTVYLNEALVNAAYRNYRDKVDLTAAHQIEVLDKMLVGALTTPFTFMRDGKKKLGYVGAAHIAAVYFVAIPIELDISYHDDNYNLMGWFTQKELQNVVAAQEGLAKAGLSYVPDTFSFADPVLHRRAAPLVGTPIEPWSVKLIMDESGEFEHIANFVTPPDDIC